MIVKSDFLKLDCSQIFVAWYGSFCFQLSNTVIRYYATSRRASPWRAGRRQRQLRYPYRANCRATKDCNCRIGNGGHLIDVGLTDRHRRIRLALTKYSEKVIKQDTARRFDILVIGEEPHIAYNRVGLSTYFEHRKIEDLYLNPKEWVS